MRSHVVWMAAGLAALAAAGCGSSPVNRAGQAVTGRPVTLTLADHEGEPGDVIRWAEAVERLSHGSLKISVDNGWRGAEPDYDKGIIADVRNGKVDLAKVAARAYDEVGVTSFQPLLAPLLIDSTRLEAEVLRGPIGDRALRGTARLGLVGLALYPTELRRPIGITRTLRGPSDYRGAQISTREGRVTAATLRALGAHRVALPATDPLLSVDGAELPPTGVSQRSALPRSARGITGNVVLWPKPITIVMNRAAFARLSPAQQDALRGAADVARAATAEEEGARSADARNTLCLLGARIVTASPAALTGLRTAVQPVYDKIARAPGNADALTQIERMKSASRPESLSCPDRPLMQPAHPQPRSPLLGTYLAHSTKQELARSPLLHGASELEDDNWGDMQLRFSPDGWFHYSLRNRLTAYTLTGTYRTTGDTLKLEVADTGARYGFRWSLYRGTLELRRDPRVGEAPTMLIIKPWQTR
jgi:TRAP-type transport system periplasmic protein